jgi:hypothetical protein
MLLVKSIGHFRIQHFSKMKFIAKAAIPDAEEAIPELWERILCVDCKMIVFRKGK